MTDSDRFLKSIKKGDTQLAAQILQSPSFNVNELDPKTGKTYLQLAMESDEFDIFKLLLNHKAINLEIGSKDGQSSIETAILINSIEYTSLLLGKHINPKTKNGKGQSVMQTAIKNKINPEILKKLIHYNFDINEKIEGQGSLLNLAITYDQLDNFKCLLDQPNIEITIRDEEGNTSIMLATSAKRGEFILLILEKLKAERFSQIEKQFYINAQNEDGDTVLHLAAAKDYQTILDILIREGELLGIDKLMKNKRGETYLDIVERNKETWAKEQQAQNKRREERFLRNKEK